MMYDDSMSRWERERQEEREREEARAKRIKKMATGGGIFIVVLIAAIVLLCACTVKVPQGYVAVQYNINGGVMDKTLGQGWHLKSPVIHTTNYTVGLEQSYLTKGEKGDSEKNERFTACSKEGKALGIDLTFSYQYEGDKVAEVFTKFKGRSGEQVRDYFIKPNAISWTKEVLAKYEVADIIGEKRSEVNAELNRYLAQKLSPYGIHVENASLINVSVDEQTQKAIDNKIKAQQDAQTQAIENKKNIEKAEADAKVIMTNAKAEAEANKLLQKSLNEQVLQQQYLEKWNGTLPQYMTGNGTGVMFNMNN